MLIGEKRLLTVYDDILNVVGQGRGKNQWNSVADLLVKISLVSQKNSYLENYAEVVNITRRIMKLVRESKVVSSSSMIDQTSLVHVLMGGTINETEENLSESQLNELKDDVLEAVRMCKVNFETHLKDISMHSLDYLKPHDRVLCWGYSEAVAAFIEAAVDSKSRKTPITLIVSGPSSEAVKFQSRMKKYLDPKLKNTLQIIIIGDGAFFSVMPIVQKVLLPTMALLPDGSLRAEAGNRAICLAARAHSVPVLALCPTHKIYAEYPVDEVELVRPDHAQEVKPAWDKIKSNLVSLVITSEGGLPPSDTYRLHNELYHQGDCQK